ncbi:unnamed protein product [Rotaria sordida]|uniref:Geminin n=1 Tax=Rotaria sordida TaxID=392033 RepID=A0A818PFT3_9BILA|nr:unnamed protein product [Rotaria sordida]CAF3622732.1 unnamed protein product [Rotaria sordida]
MTQNSPSKFILLHPTENHRTTCQKTKNTTQNMSTNTDDIQFNHDISTNTPNYAEQMATALDNGNTAEEIVQMLMQNEASESYWKLISERRKQAIEETVIENEQLHNVIDDLSKENEQLRALSDHCDYLQNVLNSFTNEHDSLLDDSSTN